MKKLFYRLAVCLGMVLGFWACSDDDKPGGGEGAMYQVTVQQSGKYRSYIKSVVVVRKDGKEIDRRTLTFEDGKEISADDLKLYYK